MPIQRTHSDFINNLRKEQTIKPMIGASLAINMFIFCAGEDTRLKHFSKK